MEGRPDIVEFVEQKQLVWYGHVQRMETERLPKRMMLWKPKERRKRGRPRTSWREGIDRAMGERVGGGNVDR